mgnify:CR=1 FL=1
MTQSTKKILDSLRHAVCSINSDVNIEEVGYITYVADGIAEASGMQKVQYGEVVIFEDDTKGLVLDIQEYSCRIILFSNIDKIKAGMRVRRSKQFLFVPCGEELLGRVVNSLGEAIDDQAPIKSNNQAWIEQAAPSIMNRFYVNEPLLTGIVAIDSMIPIGRGQRELILGDRRTGKTTIAIDTILNQLENYNQGKPIYCVYVAIGQKMSDIAKLHALLKEKGADKYTTFVVASASQPASMQFIAPYAGCAIAEYFRDKGHDALIVYDDLSKHATAYRELSLLMRRMPGREAYPGDIFYIHSRLLERAACIKHETKNEKFGSLTALPIVETQEDATAYIPTNLISITDGQISLDQNMFLYGQRPAINIGRSVSRIGSAAQIPAIKQVAAKAKLELMQYTELKTFTQFITNVDATTQKLLNKGDRFIQLLQQRVHELYSSTDQAILLLSSNLGLFDKYPTADILEHKKKFLTFVHTNAIKLIKELQNTLKFSDEMKLEIKDLIQKYQVQVNQSEKSK